VSDLSAPGENPKQSRPASRSRSCTSHILWICNGHVEPLEPGKPNPHKLNGTT
jgi:hypothetical protein